MKKYSLLKLFSLILLTLVFVSCGGKTTTTSQTTSANDPYFALKEDNSKIENNQTIEISQNGKLEDVVYVENAEAGSYKFYILDSNEKGYNLNTQKLYDSEGNRIEQNIIIVATINKKSINVKVKVLIKDTTNPLLMLYKKNISLMISEKFNLTANIEAALDTGDGPIDEFLEYDCSLLPGSRIENGILYTDDCELGEGFVTVTLTDRAGNVTTQNIKVTITEVRDTILFDTVDEAGYILENLSYDITWNPRLHPQYASSNIAFADVNNSVIGLKYDYVKWYTENAPERLAAWWSLIYVVDSNNTLKYIRHYYTNELWW